MSDFEFRTVKTEDMFIPETAKSDADASSKERFMANDWASGGHWTVVT